MKRASLLILSLCLFFASCEKEAQEEWGRFYGFTQADVVGHYEANPDQSLYEALPTEGAVVYNNATIDITAVGSTSLSARIVIPGQLNKVFVGPIDMSDENRSDIALVNAINAYNKEDFLVTVYKNDEGRVRFHGRVKKYYYKMDSSTHQLVLDRSENWGFDVIKE
ncbi:MAG: hypothetical protein K6F96_09495 [Bacteroidales bacterium]|nr:hypothetical protein [Bacteroidales bacterium]